MWLFQNLDHFNSEIYSMKLFSKKKATKLNHSTEEVVVLVH